MYRDEKFTSQAKNPNSPNYVSQEVQQWIGDTFLPLSLLQGTQGMIAAGKAFLLPHELEASTSFDSRLASSTLLNAYRKTCSFMAGQVFQQEITFDESMPSEIEEWNKSIDSKGNNINVFAKRLMFNGLGKGCSHIFIDMPRGDGTIKTLKDQKAAGIRPYFKEIRPEDMLGALVDESGELAQVRFLESRVKRLGDYGSITVPVVRILEPGKWKTIEYDQKGEKVFEDEGEFDAQIIPFVSYIPGEEMSIITGMPPMDDLAYLNAKHWRSSSDQDNYLSYCRFPLYFSKMLGDLEKLPMGGSLINSDNEYGDMKTVEMTGASIQAGLNDLKETEAQMALYGLQQLIPRTGNMTATEKALVTGESNSSLGTWTVEFNDILEEAYKIAGILVGIDIPEESIQVNTEFNLGVVDPLILKSILDSYDRGILSAQGCFTEFKRRGVYDVELLWDDMEADKEEDLRKQDNGMSGLANTFFGQK